MLVEDEVSRSAGASAPLDASAEGNATVSIAVVGVGQEPASLRAASLRESHLRPIRVYSDETYIHANYASKNSWGLTPKAWLETVTYE